MSPAHIPDEALIRRLPLPLARLYRNAANAETPLERFLAAYYLWEAGLKLLAAAALAEFARRKIADANVAGRLGTLSRPSLGHWWEYARLLPPVLAEAGADEFAPIREAFRRAHSDMPAAARLDIALERLLAGDDHTRALAATPRPTVRLSQLFTRLVEYRRQELGHGAMGLRGALYYETLGPVLLAGAAEIVGRVCLPADFRLVYVSQVVSTETGDWSIRRFNLTGEIPLFEPLPVPAGEEGLPVRPGVYLEACPLGAPGGARDFRSLHPLTLCDPGTKEVLFLNAGLCEAQAEYLCYTDNRTLRRTDLRADHHTLLSNLLGRAVNESEVVQWTKRALPGEPPASRVPVGPTPGAGAVGVLLPALLDAISAPPGVPAEAIRAAYHAVIPPGWEVAPGGRPPADAVTSYCRDLARCPLQAGVAPLVAFARRLAALCPADFAEMLEEAIRAAAKCIGENAPPSPPAPQLVPPELHPAGAAAEPNYLLIAIRAAMSELGRYEVKGWLSTGPNTVYLEAGEERHTREQLPDVVDRLRALAESRAVTLGNLWVEFLLPRELIPVAVDQWGVTIEDELGTNAVGAEHPVLVRAADRYYCAEKFRAKRLQALGDRGRGLSACASTRVIRDLPPPEQKPGFALYPREVESKGRWLYNQLKDDRAVLCAVLETPPPPEAARDWDVLNTLLAVGMPVVAWSRGQPAVAEEIVRLLSGCPLGELPDRIRRLRGQAVDADPEHAGRHVSLLWDDPDRCPPEFDPQNQLRPT